ncbi:MAG: ABC transporter ATP-binding protein [Promethearchaeota archaeon]
MTRNKFLNDSYPIVEFSLAEDPFEMSRKKGPIRWILSHIFSGKKKYIIFIVFITTIVSAIINSQIFIIIGLAINDFINKQTTTLIFYVVLMLILGITAPFLRLFSFMLREILAQRMEKEARQEFTGNLLGKSQSFHEDQKSGELMARATEDVRMLNFLMSPAISLIFESFTSLVIPIIFILINFPLELAIAPIIFTILFLIALRNYTRKLGPITMDLRTEFGSMNDALNENLSNIELIKATAQETSGLQKFRLHASKYRDAYLREGKAQAKYTPLLLLAITLTIGLAQSINLYFQGYLTIGQIISYLGLFTQLRFPTNISIFIFAIVKLARAASDRLLEILKKETEIDENSEGLSKDIQGKLNFENVSFKYPGDKNYILKNISFEINPGNTLAIVGSTGSGKTTLTKLISRLYDVTEGKISIDDNDIRNYSLKSLRSQISYIEQDIFLFSTTIYDNITFGRTSSKKEIIEVSKQAQAFDFISRLPNGFDSEIGERGVQLSGGERQSVAIARAFLTNPKILILDDSTSAIDSETEDEIQKAINNILKDRTTILITHRLSQIRWADLIIVLKNGSIEALGTHEELLKSSEEYQKIFVKRFDVKVQELLKEVL